MIINSYNCFNLYKISRGIIRLYTPFLDKLNLTYPQYLVLLVLYEKKEIPFNELSSILELSTGTLSPLIKKMIDNNLILKKKAQEDCRKSLISLTTKAIELESTVAEIHETFLSHFEITEEENIKITESINLLLEKINNFSKEENIAKETL
ncbi:DNA-binding transcriptional regulator, MarR family [Cetobacterium ceti]|uniref:HTH-type transcriptional regulator SarZ n=1 Tax=Cetobacterium ceti TaxID=180163 RepID=A0A1T4PSE2_9FUSO|nr:MarR family transcriptional regulator [Cetobacterium ceti]SJZ94463.1 DNA-binding transcriptional regulator, MarR family [Cetobacterium ceti]